MFESIKQYKILIIFVVVLVGLFFVAQTYLINDQGDLFFVTQTVDPTGELIGDEISRTLAQLEQLNLNNDIFEDELFLSLIDYYQEPATEAIGRNNPFAEIGTDGRYLGVPIDLQEAE